MAMNYGSIPGVAKPVSRLIQGTVMLCTKQEQANFTLFDAILEQGGTTFDTAHVYGNGEVERVFGRWIQSRDIREQVVILDKGAHHSQDRKRVTPHDIASDVADSMARLGTDFIDLYVLHRDDESVPVGPIVEALNAQQAAGRIGAFGGSNWRAARVQAANDYARERGLTPFAVSSPHFSLAEQMNPPWDDCITITGAAGEEERAWYAKEQLPLLCWSSLAGGWFSGRLTRKNQEDHKKELYMYSYCSEDNFTRLERADELSREKGCSIAQIALAYVLHQPFQVFPLVAAYTPDEFKALVAALDVSLTPEEIAWLDLRAPQAR